MVVDFIVARLTEDESLAEAAADAMPKDMDSWVDGDRAALGAFLERWSPWRVIALCVLGRRLVSQHRPVRDELGRNVCATCDNRRGTPGWPCRTLVLLANEWSEQPDFRVEWTAHRLHAVAPRP